MRNLWIKFISVSLGLIIVACSSTQTEMLEPEKPGWIQSHQRGEFLGVAEAPSEEEARSKSRADGLSQIRFSVHGGHVFSLTELDLKEGDEGVSETYQQMSKLSVEGYVQGTTLKSYVEQDFAGQELIYRCYTLMAFNYAKYRLYLMEQSTILESLLGDLQADVQKLNVQPNDKKTTALFQKIKVTGSALKAVMDAAGAMNTTSDLAGMNERFRELTLEQLGKVELAPRNQSLVCNPFSNFGIDTKIHSRLKSGATLNAFPIAVHRHARLESSTKTNDRGMVVIERQNSWVPGEEIVYKIVPDIPSLDLIDLPSVELKLTFKYMLNTDIEINAKNIRLSSDDFESELPAVFEKRNVSIVDGQPHGRLKGKITMAPSSTTYGVYYTEANASVTFYPDTNADNKYEYTLRKVAEGRSYEKAAEDAFINVVGELANQISDQLAQNSK